MEWWGTDYNMWWRVDGMVNVGMELIFEGGEK
jgi:hypothetical protein